MTLEFIDNYINKKIAENEDMIIYTFYELRIKNNLSEEDVCKFLELNKIRLENLGYKTYFTGEKFTYEGIERIVQDNELMVAIK